MRWYLRRILDRLRPRPGSLTVSSVVPLRQSVVRERIESLPPGGARLPGAVVEMRDAGPDRTEVSVTTRLPFGRFFLSLMAPWIVPAMKRRLMAHLFPGLRRGSSPGGEMDYVLFVPFTADQSVLSVPFVPDLQYVLQIHLTQKTVPFEENAVHYEVFQETSLRTEHAKHTGLCSIPVSRPTVFFKGSGGVLKADSGRIELGLCDERKKLAAQAAFKLDRPFGKGLKLPLAARPARSIFSATDNMEVELCEETVERAANEIWFLEILAGRQDLEDFLSALLGVRAVLTDSPVFIPHLKIERTSSKILSVPDLVF